MAALSCVLSRQTLWAPVPDAYHTLGGVIKRAFPSAVILGTWGTEISWAYHRVKMRLLEAFLARA